MDAPEKIYDVGERDIDEQGDHYYRHVYQMTAEGLNSKSAIAAELAHRDIQIKQLQQENAELKRKHQKLIHVGYTSGHQIDYAKKESGSFYPDTDNECWIPLYMLSIHAHRAGPDSEIFCHLLAVEKENAALKAQLQQRVPDDLISWCRYAQRLMRAAGELSGWHAKADALEELITAAPQPPEAVYHKEELKRLCTDFFYWWYNQPGSNTQQGFDEWWEKTQEQREGE